MKKWLDQNSERINDIHDALLIWGIICVLAQANLIVLIIVLLLAIVHIISAYIKRNNTKDMIVHGIFAALYVFMFCVNV